MKFSCLQENLLKGLQIVNRAVAPRASMPILSNVKISTEKGRIKLSATNFETTISTVIGGAVDAEGATTVPAKLLKDFISNLPAGTVKAELKKDILHISADKSKSKLNGSNAQDYPELPSFPEKAAYLELEPKVLADAVSLVSFAAGTDNTRPIFTGVFFNFDGKNLTLVSTDGFRLSEKVLEIGGDTEPFSAIIPAKALSEITKIFASSEEPIKMLLKKEENMVMFESGDTFVATVVLDGEYLDYKRIIPSETQLTAVFNSDDLLEAVRLTSIFASEDNKPLKIRFDPEGEIKVNSLEEETGNHESKFEAEIEGDLTEIAFSAKYLMDYLNSVKSEKVTLTTSGNMTACIIKPVENETYLHLIMPLQI